MKKFASILSLTFFLLLSGYSFSQRKVVVTNNDNQPVPVKNVNTPNNPVPVTNTNTINNPVPVKNTNNANDPVVVKNVNTDRDPVPVKVVNNPAGNPQVKTLFMQSSTAGKVEPSYGKLTITAGQGETKVIEFIHCYGDRPEAYFEYVIDGETYSIKMNTVKQSSSYSAPFQVVIKNGQSVSFEVLDRPASPPGTRYITVTGYSLR